MRNILLILALALLFSSTLNAKPINSDAKKKAQEKLRTLKSDDFLKLQKPKTVPFEKQEKYNEVYNKYLSQTEPVPRKMSSLDMDSLPVDFRTPGEFEESQAVFISWPSYAYDENGDYLETFTPGVGLYWYLDSNNRWQYEMRDIVGYLLDLEEESPFSYLWAELADELQKELPVWIRVSAPEDTTELKLFMKNKGRELYNYEFVTDEDGENAFWARDFGPFGVYHSDDDSLMFVVAEYYPWRPVDDLFPVKLAQMKGYDYYKSPLEMEGGNFMTDGHGNGFYGNVVYINNSDNQGAGATRKQPMSSTQVNEEISKIFNLKDRFLMISLRCDGGTGHIDIYTKMANDEEILITKYPEVYNKFQFPDYATANNNRNAILSKDNAYGKKFRFLEVPLPTDDDGRYNRTTCQTFGLDARGYINGLTVNKTFLVPTYSNLDSGNIAGDKDALAIIQKHMPGYRIVPIDSRILTPLGGAIHCITMQIPAENPVYIKHSQFKGEYYFEDILENNNIAFKGNVRNKSGFANGKLYYKCADSEEWNEKDLNIDVDTDASKSDFTFNTTVNFDEIACGYKKDINYYFEFETNNGKTAQRPITAPAGYYTFSISDMPSSVMSNFDNHNIQLYPNPANDLVYVTLPNSGKEITIDINDLMGNKINSYYIPAGEITAGLNISNLQSGLYLCKISDGNNFQIVKLVVTK